MTIRQQLRKKLNEIHQFNLQQSYSGGSEERIPAGKDANQASSRLLPSLYKKNAEAPPPI